VLLLFTEVVFVGYTFQIIFAVIAVTALIYSSNQISFLEILELELISSRFIKLNMILALGISMACRPSNRSSIFHKSTVSFNTQ